MDAMYYDWLTRDDSGAKKIVDAAMLALAGTKHWPMEQRVHAVLLAAHDVAHPPHLPSAG